MFQRRVRPPIPVSGDGWALLAFCDSGCSYCVEIRPLLVATIHRLPHRIIESIRPTSGTVSPRDTFRVPLGPSKTAKVPSVSLMNQPGIVVGLVSGTGAGLDLVSWAVLRGPHRLSRVAAPQ